MKFYRPRRPVHLESLIGVRAGSEEGRRSGVDRNVLQSNMSRILRHRTAPVHFHWHFALFNAFTLLRSHTDDQEIFDLVDLALADYILTCRTDSEGNFMLIDLILDHWPADRAARLSRVILTGCRYKHRVKQFLEAVGYLPLDGGLKERLDHLAKSLRRSGRERDRAIAELLASQLAFNPNARSRRLKLPVLEPRRTHRDTELNLAPPNFEET